MDLNEYEAFLVLLTAQSALRYLPCSPMYSHIHAHTHKRLIAEGQRGVHSVAQASLGTQPAAAWGLSHSHPKSVSCLLLCSDFCGGRGPHRQVLITLRPEW